jgi:hypothetical protein
LPSEKCTAFTSSIIFAVMSAMKDLSAKSMESEKKCAILAGVEPVECAAKGAPI